MIEAGEALGFLKNQSSLYLFKWVNPGLFFVYFRLFKHKIYRKNIGVGGIQTQIVVIEGEQADHLFTFTPPDCEVLLLLFSTSVLDETT